MTDIITKARREWCETRVDDALDCTLVFRRPPKDCPPSVVAALLDLRAAISRPTFDDPRLSYVEVQIERDDLLAVDNAITRALEGK